VTATTSKFVPGPIERKLSSRLHFKLFGRWPQAVADERIARFVFDPTNINAILDDLYRRDPK
jgi:hypothetical protein